MDSRQPTSSFSDTSREILQSLCMQASEVVENAKLLEQARENEKMQRDLDIARVIQQGLLPCKFPQTGGYQVTGHNVACYEVGGDYFDVIDLGEGRLGVVIADVSGKGITAALLASMLQGVFYATANSGLSPASVVQKVNAYLTERSTPDKYATLFYGLLEPDGRLMYVNAGHNPPMLIRPGGGVHPLDSDCLPIGMFPFAQYQENQIVLEPGCTLVLYTDGVTEANNAEDEMFGEDRLTTVLSQTLGTPEEVRDRVLVEVRNFASGHPQSDDITVVVVRRV
jgi:sigma-B regulation protein RsbU (phosphoserine phosphatase)